MYPEQTFISNIQSLPCKLHHSFFSQNTPGWEKPLGFFGSQEQYQLPTHMQ